jgi:hypothetical protein
MGHTMYIKEQTLARIYSMYAQGYTVTTISNTTGYPCNVVWHRIRKAKIKRIITVKVPRKPGKYDHLFDEPTAQGKMYEQYKK